MSSSLYLFLLILFFFFIYASHSLWCAQLVHSNSFFPTLLLLLLLLLLSLFALIPLTRFTCLSLGSCTSFLIKTYSTEALLFFIHFSSRSLALYFSTIAFDSDSPSSYTSPFCLSFSLDSFCQHIGCQCLLFTTCIHIAQQRVFLSNTHTHYFSPSCQWSVRTTHRLGLLGECAK